MQKRFRNLSVISTLLKIIGAVEMVLAVGCLILLPLALSANDGIFTQLGLTVVPGVGMLSGLLLGVVIFLFGGISGLLLFAAGELINVLLATEENTRATVILLQAQRQGPAGG